MKKALKRLVVFLLALSLFMESCLSYTSLATIHAKEPATETLQAQTTSENTVGDETSETPDDSIDATTDENTDEAADVDTDETAQEDSDEADDKTGNEDSSEIPEEITEETLEETTNDQADVIYERDSLADSAYLENIEVKRVAIDEGVTISAPSIYKDMDYSFLKSYNFGSTNDSRATVTFRSAEDLKVSQDVRLKVGAIIRTNGYYKAGDGGNGVYEISKSSKTGGIKLQNGLYALLLPDVYTDSKGNTWALFNVKQFGATNDGTTPSQGGIGDTAAFASDYVKNTEDVSRGIVYLPTGEYKCTNEVHVNDAENLNIVGDGSSSVLFTDNDYRKDEGYAEHFLQSWNGKNLFWGNFRVEAREVDLYHYMRQFSLFYCEEIYIYNVDLIIPQESYSSYYFEDKQYSNFCLYTGNNSVTVDDCMMVQLSGTYRGANVGILDIWSKGEDNITVMNCDLYGNARDEQIGIFSTNKDSAHVKNVDFINNTIHSVQLKYTDIIGTRTMCFTLAYADSKNIDDIRIAGNHFICETDSKFMTFGAVTNCVVEDNIIEIIASYNNWGSVFDSANSNSDNIQIRNNEFFLTSTDGICGKSSFAGGCMTITNNRIFSDSNMSFSFTGKRANAKNNEIIFLKKMGGLAENVNEFSGNELHLYKGNAYVAFAIDPYTDTMSVLNNTIYDYTRYIGKRNNYDALTSIIASGTDGTSLIFSGNTYYAPNKKYTGYDSYQGVDDKETDDNGNTTYYNRLFYTKPEQNQIVNYTYSNNTLQGVKGYVLWGKSLEESGKNVVIENNTLIPYREDLTEDEPIVEKIDLLHNGQVTTNLTSTQDSIQLSAAVSVSDQTSTKEIRWYSSVEGIATVSETGLVTRHMYGDVTIYAVATDGSGIYGQCTIRFKKNLATSLTMAKNSINLEPGLKYYADYTVAPEAASQNLLFSSSNTNIATVSKTGTITAIAPGDAIITGTTTDGSNLSKTITVHVAPLTVKKITLDQTNLYYTMEQIGTSTTLTPASYYPENATNQKIGKWESTNPSVATVTQSGVVTVKGSGTTEIRAYSTDNSCYGKCNVFVQMPAVKNFKASSVTKDCIILTWDKTEGTYGYYLYQWNNTSSTWEALNQGAALKENVTSYKVPSLNPDTEYKFCIRAYQKSWAVSPPEIYEGKDSIVTAKTYTYQPVKELTIDPVVSTELTIVGLTTKELKLRYTPTTDTMPNLDFTYKMADESIARITGTPDKSTAGSIVLTIEGLKYGTTTLTITSNDDQKKSVVVPIGVVPDISMDKPTASVVYNRATITFPAAEDESNIDGYLIRLRISYSYYMVAFVPKTGAKEYSYVVKDLSPGGTYHYVVAACLTNGTNYFAAHSKSVITDAIPYPTLATSLSLGQKLYQVECGKTLDITALLGAEDVSEHNLYWEVLGGKLATIKSITTDADANTISRAQITGKLVGVTDIKAVTIDGSDLEANGKLIVTPGAIQNVKGVLASNCVQLSWNAYENVSGYRIYKWNETAETFQLIADTKATSYKDSKLSTASSYFYKVVGYLIDEGNVYEGNKQNTLTVTKPAPEGSGSTTNPDPKPSPNQNTVKIGKIYKVSGYLYKVTGKNTVSVAGATSKKKKTITIKSTVKIKGRTYKVTAISNHAFKRYKKLQKVTIGKYVTKIGKYAFYNDKKLKKVVIKSSNLKSIGKKAFKGINKKATFYVPKKKKKKYKKLLKKSTGYVSTMKIK